MYLLEYNGWGNGNHTATYVNVPNLMTKGAMQDAGGDQSHENMPPYIVLKACSKTASPELDLIKIEAQQNLTSGLTTMESDILTNQTAELDTLRA